VHYFVPHVARRAIFIERPLDNIDGVDYAGAKIAGLSQDHLH
jgi:hypothetical protein